MENVKPSNLDKRPATADSHGTSIKTPGKQISVQLVSGSKKNATVVRPKSAAKISAKVPVTPSVSSSSDALNLSTSSASASREGAMLAKLQNTEERIKKVSELKEKWAKEKEEKISRNEERRAAEIQRVRELTGASAEQRKTAAQKHREQEERETQTRIEAAVQAAADRAFQKAEIDRQSKARRRQSMLLNAEIKAKASLNEKKQAANFKAREDDILEQRRQNQIDLREAKRAEAERQRNETAQRTAELKVNRDREAALQAARQEEERALAELRRHAWQDDQAAKVEEARKQREDLAARLDAWRVARTAEEEMLEKDREAAREQLEARRADWQTLQAYKKSQAERDRQSVAERLAAWREEQTVEQRKKEQEAEATELERELSRAALEDVRAYQEEQKRRTRDSLLVRMGKAQQDKAVALAEAEAAKIKELEDRELTQQARRDAENAREVQRLRDRQSLAANLVAAKRAHEVDLISHRTQLEEMHLQLEARRGDWQQRRAQQAEEKRDRRMSVALRLESWREQRLAEEKQAAARRMREEDEARLREIDREAVLELRRAEKEAELADRLNGSLVL